MGYSQASSRNCLIRLGGSDRSLSRNHGNDTTRAGQTVQGLLPYHHIQDTPAFTTLLPTICKHSRISQRVASRTAQARVPTILAKCMLTVPALVKDILAGAAPVTVCAPATLWRLDVAHPATLIASSTALSSAAMPQPWTLLSQGSFACL